MTKTINIMAQATIKPKPFLKWAGGKSWLVLEGFVDRIPKSCDRYIEPFLGGGAVLLQVLCQRPDMKAISFDINKDLIYTWRSLRDECSFLVHLLKGMSNDQEFFYKIREWDRTEDIRYQNPVHKAQRFIYLNKTGYNGLCRYNREGQFNVPFGRYKNPTICDEENLRLVSELIQSADFKTRNFKEAIVEAGAGDFVFADPPYVPISETANFTGYAGNIFDLDEQIKLRDCLKKASERGALFSTTNSDTPFVREIYAEFNIQTRQVKRSISCNGKKRESVGELLISNY